MFGVVLELGIPLRCGRQMSDLTRRNLLKVAVTHTHVSIPSEAEGSVEDSLQLSPVDGWILSTKLEPRPD